MSARLVRFVENPYLLLTGLLLVVSPLSATLTVQLLPSLHAPQPVGTRITWQGTAQDTNPGTIDFRFSVSEGSQPYQILQDYDVGSSFLWAPASHEGLFLVRVTARNLSTLETAEVSFPFTISSRITGNLPVISATGHPLVALYSAPECPAGSKMKVKFGTNGVYHVTNTLDCTKKSMNFYVAGMLPRTGYQMNYEIVTGQKVISGPIETFTTGPVGPGLSFPKFKVVIPGSSQTSQTQSIVLMDTIAATGAYFPTAVDFKADVIWYYPEAGQPSQLGTDFFRPVAGGTMLYIANSADGSLRNQILRETDLVGNPILQTSAMSVSQQLQSLGKLGIIDFDHDAIRLPNGHTLVLASQEEIFPAGTQGSTAPVDILGNAIIDLDANLQVYWSWSSFDFLDINRTAILGETCINGQSADCPQLTLAPVANDWLHSTSLTYIPSSGDLLIALRNQDLIAKIDYNNGLGSGAPLWALGNGGNFTISSSDPSPWFTHPFFAQYELNGTSVLSVFDNGNTRVAQNPGIFEHSRGQVLNIDETNFAVTLQMNVDLGVYSMYMGSAQRLDNGNYFFTPGWIQTNNLTSLAQEFLPAGTQNFTLSDATATYRSYRMDSLYLLDAPTN